jgi:hypothetical protein
VPPQALQHEQTQPHNSSVSSLTTSQMTPEDFDKRWNDRYDTKGYEEAREDCQETTARATREYKSTCAKWMSLIGA